MRIWLALKPGVGLVISTLVSLNETYRTSLSFVFVQMIEILTELVFILCPFRSFPTSGWSRMCLLY